MKETIEKYSKNTFVIATVCVVIVLVLVLVYQAGKRGGMQAIDQSISATSTTNSTSSSVGVSQSTQKSTAKTVTTNVSTVSGVCGLRITSPVSYAYVGFPLTIKGTIDAAQAGRDGCTWNTELSNAGSAELFYNLRNQGWQGSGTMVPVTMQSTGAATSTLLFTVSMNLYTTALGLTSGSPLKIIFTDNPVHSTGAHSFTYYLYVR